MKEIQTLKEVHEECQKQIEKFPQFQPLVSIELQLQYLIDLADGKISDRSRLFQIIIGLYAAREIETIDIEFANRLYEVEHIVDSMRRNVF